MNAEELADRIMADAIASVKPKPRAAPPKPTPKVTVLTPDKPLSVEAQRERLDRHTAELVEAEKEEILEAENEYKESPSEHNRRNYLDLRRKMGQYHGDRKRAVMEAEYWAKHNKTQTDYDPMSNKSIWGM